VTDTVTEPDAAADVDPVVAAAQAPVDRLSELPRRELAPIVPLHEPMLPLTVLYDDLCEFCRWTAANLRRWDRAHNLRFRPFHEVPFDPILRELFRGHDLADHVHAIDAAGRMAAGGEAFLAITAVLPHGTPVSRLVSLSRPAAVAVDLGYRLLNRHRGVLVDLFGLDGPRLWEPDSFDPETGEIPLQPAT
jgi:predicted DCC family thiol-disulfide oxidoreductase YuxK